MASLSAGILMYRRDWGEVQVLLVHPGGPFWAKRDLGAWSIPKGEHDPGEDPWAAAVREFKEETGLGPPDGVRFELGEEKQRSGKRITAFALEGSLDANLVRSNLCTLEWPPRSGRTQSFPEVDRAEWFPIPVARQKIVAGQVPFLDRLAQKLGS
jgi:predicted NUDIX family NTP pyrophosphohydrolase